MICGAGVPVLRFRNTPSSPDKVKTRGAQSISASCKVENTRQASRAVVGIDFIDLTGAQPQTFQPKPRSCRSLQK